MTNVNDKQIKDFTTDDYFKFINLKKIEIEKFNKKLSELVDLFKNCCTYNEKGNTYLCYKDKFANLMNTNKGKEKIIKILKEVLGNNFFILNGEELEKYKTLGMFTKESLGVIFDDVIGSMYGISIKMPTNYDELFDTIHDILVIVQNPLIPTSKKENFIHSFVTIENLVASKFEEIYKAFCYQKYFIERFNELYQKYNKKESINKLDADLVALLNSAIQEKVTDDNGIVTFNEISFGDLSNEFIERYNLELKEKEDKKQINKYFKKLRNKSLDNLKLGDFPSNLDKESYVLLRKEIESYVKSKRNDKKDLTYLIPLLDMYYYSDSNIKEKQK